MADFGPSYEAPPVVGVVCRRWLSVAGATQIAHGVLSSYIEAIEEVGGAVVLVALQGLDRVEPVLARCDGLLLTGGEDIVIDCPANGEAPKGADATRDEVERALADQAIRNGIPVLGICRGMQLINVACGGTLADVDETAANAARHVNDWRAGEQYVHDIHITPDSILVGAAQGRTTMRVNSHHSRCVDQLGADVVVTAQASDGVIEAIERRGGSYCVGVQWHPECLLDRGDDFALAILTSFVQACRRTRRTPCSPNK